MDPSVAFGTPSCRRRARQVNSTLRRSLARQNREVPHAGTPSSLLRRPPAEEGRPKPSTVHRTGAGPNEVLRNLESTKRSNAWSASARVAAIQMSWSIDLALAWMLEGILLRTLAVL